MCLKLLTTISLQDDIWNAGLSISWFNYIFPYYEEESHDTKLYWT